jgi:2'-5' RNA ligase
MRRERRDAVRELRARSRKRDGGAPRHRHGMPRLEVTGPAVPDVAGDTSRGRHGGASLRLFFALWPPEPVRGALARYAVAAQQIAPGRAMRAETLHLTLAFLGDTPLARLPALLDAAGRVTPCRFTLVLDRAAWWKHNRIVWAGSTAVPEPLDRMVSALRDQVAAAGFRFDPKPFVVHATLVRNAAPRGTLPDLEPIVWDGNGFVLVRSTLGPRGSRYETIGEWRAE